MRTHNLFIFLLICFQGVTLQARVLKATAKISVSSGAQPTSISNMKAGDWYRISNSKMRSAVTTTGQGNVAAVMSAWGGGALDSKRNRLIVWGGGHSDYSGNEIYAFDIPTLKWLRLTNPTSSPVSVHTYNQLQYLPKQDAFFAIGGSTWPNGSASNETWLFNFGLNQWTKGPNMPGSVNDFWNFNMTTDYDPLNDLVLVAAYAQTGSFNATTKTWKTYAGADRNLYETGAFDTKRRKFFKFGGGIHAKFDVDNVGSMANQQTVATVGDKTIENCTSPGLQYDPVADRIVGWCSGSDVYSFNVDTSVWTKHSAVSGSGPALPSGSTGTFGRFRYIPSYNAYVVVTSIDDDVYIYRLSD